MTERMSAAEYQATAKKRNPRGTGRGVTGIEARFGGYLDTLKAAGIVQHWDFKPRKIDLLPRSGPKRRMITWTPDFRVIFEDMRQAEEVTGHRVWRCYIDTKGRWEEDALLKIRMAAVMMPDWYFFGVTSKGEKWKWERFAPSYP